MRLDGRHVLIAYAAVAVAISGCGEGSRPASRPAPRAKTPAGFVPEAIATHSARNLWLLGTAACGSRRCFSLLRTRDGGRSFTRMGTPSLPRSTTVPRLRIADDRNGFAYVPGRGGAVFTTHDGGATWARQALGDVLALATAGGNAYAVTARCSVDRCTGYRFQRSRASSDTWSAEPPPFAPDGPIVDLAAQGSRVWLLGTPAGNLGGHDRLARSTHAGHSFVTGPGPCYAGLGGEIEPVTKAVWAVCPTGNLGAALRSVDGGTTFTPVAAPGLVNSARLAASSSETAVVFGNGAGSRLLRTTDAGITWRRACVPGRAIAVSWLGFASLRVGYALVQTGWDASAKVERQALWRTTDAGARWLAVRLR